MWMDRSNVKRYQSSSVSISRRVRRSGPGVPRRTDGRVLILPRHSSSQAAVLRVLSVSVLVGVVCIPHEHEHDDDEEMFFARSFSGCSWSSWWSFSACFLAFISREEVFFSVFSEVSGDDEWAWISSAWDKHGESRACSCSCSGRHRRE